MRLTSWNRVRKYKKLTLELYIFLCNNIKDLKSIGICRAISSFNLISLRKVRIQFHRLLVSLEYNESSCRYWLSKQEMVFTERCGRQVMFIHPLIRIFSKLINSAINNKSWIFVNIDRFEIFIFFPDSWSGTFRGISDFFGKKLVVIFIYRERNIFAFVFQKISSTIRSKFPLCVGSMCQHFLATWYLRMRIWRECFN